MSRTLIYHGKKIDLALETISLPDGGTVQREMVIHPGAVVMLPFIDTERLCMVQNYRWGIGQTLLELPAGTLWPGEDSELAALRELEEETGYRAQRCRKLAEFYPSPGVLTELMHLYLVEDLTPGIPRLEVDEKLQPVQVFWTDALRMALDGTIKDGKTLLGLLLWDRLRSRRA